MSTGKHIDKVCAAVTALALLLAVLFMNGEALGLRAAAKGMGYEDRIFDPSRVHTIDIVMDGWESFLETCENEEYVSCAVVIDGEAYRNVGIRAKGNTSLSSVSAMGSDRYSFKIEFDHYDSTRSYYGLDKLSLNNTIQDTTFMKDYLTYRLMDEFGVAAPLCSYAYITINGEDWGLYLAVEGVEESFLRRNYGGDYGELYKPDSMDFGGGRGNGRDFDMERFMDRQEAAGDEGVADGDIRAEGSADAGGAPGMPPAGFTPTSGFGEKWDGGAGPDGMGGGAILQYVDDDPDSYAAIFDSAKTNPSDVDKERLIASLKGLSQGVDLSSVLDLDAQLRYLVVHNFVVNGDSYTGSMVHNYYLYEEDGRLSMIPWDYNLAFGAFQGNGANRAVNDPIDTPLSVSGDGSRPMADWVFWNEEYTELYHQYFSRFLENIDAGEIIDSAAALIAPYVERDPTKFYTYEEFTRGVEALRAFCALRAESVRGQLDGTIPSTAAGQSADGAALTDASQIHIADMGSMDGGRMPGDDFREGEDFAHPFGDANKAFGEKKPDGQEGRWTPDTSVEAGAHSPAPGAGVAAGGAVSQNGNSPLFLAVSLAVLLGGLLFAKKYRR